MRDPFDGLAFRPADILLPQNCDYTKWSVVACDQYTSQPEYWQEVEELVGSAPSTLRLILPESCLDGPSVETDIMEVNNTMTRYLREERFCTLPASLIYVERRLDNLRLRRGLVWWIWSSTTTSPARRPRCGPPRAPSWPAFRPGWRCARTPPWSCPT